MKILYYFRCKVLQKFLFFSLSITLLQGLDKILIDSTISTPKAFVHEQVLYTISIKIHQDIFDKIHSLDIARLYLPNIKSIEVERIEGVGDGEYILYQMRYCLYPTQSGIFTIEPLAVQVGFLDSTDDENTHDVFLSPKSPQTTTQTFLSATHQLEVMPLTLDSQDNLYTKTPLYGVSRLITHALTHNVGAGEPLEFDIALESYGDIFDLDFVLDIPNVSIYASPATISSKQDSDKYLHTLSKRFTLIAQETYEIPSFGYSYVQNTKVYPIASTPYAIHIQDSPIPTYTKKDSLSWWWLWIVLCGISCISIWLWWKRYRTTHKLYVLIANAHSYKALLQEILTHLPHTYAPFATILEAYLYSQTTSRFSTDFYDKKLLYALAKEFYATHNPKEAL